MRPQHRLRALQVRVAGEHRLPVCPGEVEQRRLHFTHAPLDALNLAAQPQAQRRRHLIVAAATRVELASRVADKRDEPRLDERMHVFRVRVFVEVGVAALGGAREHRAQPFAERGGLCVAQHPGGVQRLAVRHAPAHIRLEEPAVKTERAVEPREAGISPALEATAPKFFRFAHNKFSPPLHSKPTRAVGGLSRAASEKIPAYAAPGFTVCIRDAILCIYALVMQTSCIVRSDGQRETAAENPEPDSREAHRTSRLTGQLARAGVVATQSVSRATLKSWASSVERSYTLPVASGVGRRRGGC